jgi:hypothetical protein
MAFAYKLCAVIYRLVLALLIPVFLVAQILVGAAGHNSDFKWPEYLGLAFIVITVTLLTILFNIEDQKTRVYSIIRYASIALVSVSIVFEIYGLYDLFSNNDFSKDVIPISIVFLFTIISLTVLSGIIKEKI